MDTVKVNKQTNKEAEKNQQLNVGQLDSLQQPPWHVFVLGFFSFAAYIPYWGYKTWRDLKRESIEVNGDIEDDQREAAGIAKPALSPVPPRKADANQKLDQHFKDALTTFAKVNPVLRAFGLLVPILNIYLSTTLTLGIANLVPDQNSLARKKPMIATLLIVGTALFFLAFNRLDGWWIEFSLLAVIPFAVLQHWLNQYWKTVESDELLIRAGFNLWEMLLIIVGASLHGLVVTGLMIGVKY